MPVVPLQCPLCAGLLEIDTALAGQQVACPLCQGIVALPPAEFFAAMYASPAAPQVPTDVVQMACPICTGPFQVPLAMAGQQVACPHCGSGVMLPPLETPLAAAIEEPRLSPLATTEAADPLAMLPPAVEAHAASQATTSPASERLPPGPRSPATPPPKKEPTPPTPVSDRRPPGSDRKPPPGKPASLAIAPRREPISERLPPTAISKPVERVETPHELPPEPLAPPDKAPLPEPGEQPTSIESLLPPGAEMLTPGADTAAPAPSPVAAAPARPTRVIDSLLPPGATGEEAGPAVPGEQVPIPAAPDSRPIIANLPAGMAAVPTADGGFVAIRETPRTIGKGDDEVELKRLSAEEKSARRFRRNLILWGICLAILFGVLVAMMW